MRESLDRARDLATVMRGETRTHDVEDELAAEWDAVFTPYADVNEFKEAIRALKASKTSGPSGITREHLLHAPEYILEQYLTYANAVLTQHNEAQCAKEEAEVPLAKSASKVRPIVLVDIIRKVPTTTVQRRAHELMARWGLLKTAQRGTNHRACAQPATARLSTRLSSHAPANKKAPLFETEKEFRTKLFQNTYVFPSKVGLAGTARRRERGDHYQTTRWRTYILRRYTCQR